MFLDKKYIGLVSGRLDNFKQKGDNIYNFRCAYCGDSKKNRNKARGYFFQKDNTFIYKCHNCGVVESFDQFLKRNDPILYRDYKLEKFKTSNKKVKVYEKSQEEKQMFKNIFKRSFLDKYFTQVNDLSIDHEAREYLRKRKIPSDKIETLYFVDDLNCIKDDLPKYKDTFFGYDSRIVIPIFNRQKDLVGIVCRSIATTPKLRYINIKIKDEPLIYNLDNVDLNKEIFAFEGAFDSMFVDNSIAVEGVDFDKLSDYVTKNSTIIVVDNQPRNRQVVKKVHQIANKGWKMVIWPTDINDKDINQMVMGGVDKETLMYILKNNIYEGLQLKLKIADWSKNK